MIDPPVCRLHGGCLAEVLTGCCWTLEVRISFCSWAVLMVLAGSWGKGGVGVLCGSCGGGPLVPGPVPLHHNHSRDNPQEGNKNPRKRKEKSKIRNEKSFNPLEMVCGRTGRMLKAASKSRCFSTISDSSRYLDHHHVSSLGSLSLFSKVWEYLDVGGYQDGLNELAIERTNLARSQTYRGLLGGLSRTVSPLSRLSAAISALCPPDWA